MANLKQIRRRIVSVKNTKQITRAMKLVSAAKLRRAQEMTENGRAYITHLERITQELVANLPENFTHPLLTPKEQVKTRRVIVIAGDRGLCGPYNGNITKAVQEEESKGSLAREFVVWGRRGVANAHRLNWKLLSSYEGTGEEPSRWPIDEIARGLVLSFQSGECDEVVLYYTSFISAMTQRVKREVLLPLSTAATNLFASKGHVLQNQEKQHENMPTSTTGMMKYHPEPSRIFESIIPLIIKGRLRQVIVESKAAEHAARMTAMDAATNNANDLIERLRLYYNRARQSAITRELIDIVGGAEALK